MAGEGDEVPENEELNQTIRVCDLSGALAGTWLAETDVQRHIERFLSLVESPGDILDAGCGSGRDVGDIAARGPNVVGIDRSKSMLAEARARVPNASFRRMDVRHLNYPPSTFAGIWVFAVLQYLSASQKRCALAEFYRVLRPGGVLAVTVGDGDGVSVDHLSRRVALVTRATLSSMLVAAGFDILLEESQHSEKNTSMLERGRASRWIHIIAQRPDSRRVTTGVQDCPFCPEARFGTTREHCGASAELILYGDEDFWLIPDIAPLVEGHLLLIPTAHRLSFGSLSAPAETRLRRIRSRISNMLEQVYASPVVIAEHGAVKESTAGACINHAHWHFLPTALPIRATIEKHLGDVELASFMTLRQFHQNGQSYLYVEEGRQACAVPVQQLPSQFLRQTVAALGGGGAWRWQTACRTDEAAALRRSSLDKLVRFIETERDWSIGWAAP